MSERFDPFESPYLKRLRVWKERAFQMSILRAESELERRFMEKREADMERQYAEWKASNGK